MEQNLYAFFILLVEWGDWIFSRYSIFTPEEVTVGDHWMGRPINTKGRFSSSGKKNRPFSCFRPSRELKQQCFGHVSHIDTMHKFLNTHE